MKQTFSIVLLGSCATFCCLFSQTNASNHQGNVPQTQVTNISDAEEQEMQNIVLYIKKTCPYCKKVMNALDQMDKSVLVKDISEDDQLRDELIELGGKKQVPCIVINGDAKYESSDIIKWLLANKHLY